MASLFNDLSIERFGADGVTVDSTIKIPITVSSKAKWWRKLNDEVRDQRRDISRLLPRMGLDIVGLRYDSRRKGVHTTKHTYEVPLFDGSSSSSSSSDFYRKRRQAYRRIPYIYDFELYIATKTMSDSLAIVEQITPFFKPELSVTVREQTEININNDVTVVLKNMSKDDNRFDGDFGSTDLITWTLTFEARGYMYAPVAEQGVILDSLINLYDLLPDENPSKVADIRATTIEGITYDKDDPDTYNVVTTEYDYYNSSSSSSSSSSSESSSSSSSSG